jgi:hypothetical protein
MGVGGGYLPEDLVRGLALLAGHALVDADEDAGAVELPALLGVLVVGIEGAREHRDEQVQQHLPQ